MDQAAVAWSNPSETISGLFPRVGELSFRQQKSGRWPASYEFPELKIMVKTSKDHLII